MFIRNPIGWCDDTTNILTGCDKVSPGCKNCYAQVGTRARVLRSQGVETWGPTGVRAPVQSFEETVKWLNGFSICNKCQQGLPVNQIGKAHEGCGGFIRRPRLFANSNSDFLDPKWKTAEKDWLIPFMQALLNAPNIRAIILTKRPELMRDRFAEILRTMPDDLDFSGPKRVLSMWLETGFYPANLWIGVSAENQDLFEQRWDILSKIPLAVSFVSIEPMLEPINIRSGLRGVNPNPDWIIIGGESGPHHRSIDCYEIEKTAREAIRMEIPIYVKQAPHNRSGQQGKISNDIFEYKQFPDIFEYKQIQK